MNEYKKMWEDFWDIIITNPDCSGVWSIVKMLKLKEEMEK